jgi:hypothetical protein
VSTACGYSSITQLINENIDYFSFHIERKLKRADGDIGGLDVLAVVIKYSSTEVIESTCEVVAEVGINVLGVFCAMKNLQLLRHTYDKNKTNLNAYLNIFKMFVVGVQRWYNNEPAGRVFKSKKQKEDEIEDFKVSNVEPIEDFSDEVMGKTAEEMYEEDLKKSKVQLENEIEPAGLYKVRF